MVEMEARVHLSLVRMAESRRMPLFIIVLLVVESFHLIPQNILGLVTEVQVDWVAAVLGPVVMAAAAADRTDRPLMELTTPMLPIAPM